MNFSHIQAILFDWDLTLVHAQPVVRRALKKIREQYGIDTAGISMQDMYEHWEQSIIHIHEQHAAQLPPFEEFLDFFHRELVFGHRALEFVYSDLLNTLRDRGYKLGLVTYNIFENVSNVLKKGTFTFDTYVTSDAKDAYKKVDGIAEALTDLSVSPAHAVYVGDTLNDISAAHEAGLPIVSVTTGVYDEKTLRDSGADVVVDEVSDIAELFLPRTVNT